MIDLILALRKVLHRSALDDLRAWFDQYGKGRGWHVISDYVFDDPNKHDTASFVILLHHDKIETIVDYIQNIAPRDMKDSSVVSEGLIRYLTSPVAFSFNFVLDESSRFLSEYATPANMILQLEEFEWYASQLSDQSPTKDPYFEQARVRVRAFVQELKQKGNLKLARKIFIVAAYATAVFECLDIVAEPINVSWISDRDAMTFRHDGVAFEISSLMFFALKSERMAANETQTSQYIDRPSFVHVEQEERGENYLDPMIRMADYMAATVSDMNLQKWDFSLPKFEEVARACFVESANHVLINIIWTGDGFTVRRIATRH